MIWFSHLLTKKMHTQLGSLVQKQRLEYKTNKVKEASTYETMKKTEDIQTEEWNY